MLQNAYVLATFGFDTAENEPAKNLHNFAKTIAKKMLVLRIVVLRQGTGGPPAARGLHAAGARRRGRPAGDVQGLRVRTPVNNFE